MSALQHFRQAKAHVDAAERHEKAALDKYEQQMRAAGASLHAGLAALATEAACKLPPSDAKGYETWAKGLAGKTLAQARKALLESIGKGPDWFTDAIRWHVNPEAASARRQLKIGNNAKARLQAAERKTAPVSAGYRSDRPAAHVEAIGNQAVSLPGVHRLPRHDGGTAGGKPLALARHYLDKIRDALPGAPADAIELVADALRDVYGDLAEAIKQERS